MINRESIDYRDLNKLKAAVRDNPATAFRKIAIDVYFNMLCTAWHTPQYYAYLHGEQEFYIW
ncbi:hypothetical protein [Pleomorphochaeta sp. DL1XJH-081]|uniref:hypothetical protein n=1 Tax=Pleomorphochaeta sp. DL1XJH-081 TaxID=3409690 RepID=UPI003BB6106F